MTFSISISEDLPYFLIFLIRLAMWFFTPAILSVSVDGGTKVHTSWS